MRLLDLFCCEGGAGMGYRLAGFTDVVGVDIDDHSARYPFSFVQADALEYLSRHGAEFDVIHASPPCQAYSTTRHLSKAGHPELIEPTRELLVESGRPWVMENVPGAPMPSAVMLCGSMFGLGAVAYGSWRQLRRHRLFEHHVDLDLWPPYSCSHVGRPVGVYGHGGSGPRARRGMRGLQATRDIAREAMGIAWMSRDGLSQAIPPTYTEHIGRQILPQLARAAS